MLTVGEISKSFGARTLFQDVSLQINRGDRIGLVGPNGAGKSTLFSLLLREQEPDTGTLSFEKNALVGHLPQEQAPAGLETVLELAMSIVPQMVSLRRAVRAWDSAHDSGQMEGDENVHAEYSQLGGHQVEAKAKKLLVGLSFREKDFDRPLTELSGGWVMRAYLARLLVQEPDLLMLDEPTNHLDLESLIWFQEYLKNYRGAILMISHDRSFLNELTTQIFEIRHSKVLRYRGNYEDYLVQHAAAEAQLEAAYKNQQREIAHLMEFVERFRAKASKASQAQSKLKQIERMEKIAAPDTSERKIKFRFPQPPRGGQKSITLENIHHAYGQNIIYQGIKFEAERGQRVALVGPNGAGKSTLLKILGGVLPVQQGVRQLGHNIKAGYYSQYRVNMLQPDRTVFAEAMDTPERVTEEFIRTILGCFLFRGDDIYKKVEVLSGGEKSRLALVKLLLDPPNLLLMDEPTTHLDMASIDALITALEQFPGTIIFISHDVHFIRQVGNHTVRVEGGRLTHFPGGYQYYLDKTGATSAQAATATPNVAAPAAPQAKSDRKEQKRREAEQRQALSRQRKEQQQLVARLEAEIMQLENRQKELTAELEHPDTYQKPGHAMHLNREFLDVSNRLKQISQQWETEAEKVGEAE